MKAREFKRGGNVRGKDVGANDSHGRDDVSGGIASKDDSSVIPVSVIGVCFYYVHIMGGVGWKEHSAEH